jgi:hypothetical protein
MHAHPGGLALLEIDHAVVAGGDLDPLVLDPGRHPQPLADLPKRPVP